MTYHDAGIIDKDIGDDSILCTVPALDQSGSGVARLRRDPVTHLTAVLVTGHVTSRHNLSHIQYKRSEIKETMPQTLNHSQEGNDHHYHSIQTYR